ncbi:extracellular solute-binding protein, family 5, putative [Renibacterium salmoninarum ATCC 33209]|uniref:Extracellular solute-binding protein, family 5, putative n=1 Tax=Renibacterium salmoninarum (strain ATCC 33209 / DSM 20767 / JCM 11484 / NBRC 15589 / NCIMB 2235) TaxID=288705 RepID=A9WQR7_RENSM|nr:ABC transporter substrate-binding protein [Renibacterium salmoninarum]ABY23646.1 extracellular solute-binding protein, family 5, putative [Renibacterium salmoninarum ATCC 33209]
MRRRSILPVTAAAVLALSLAACTAEPAPTPSSSATTTPVTFTFGASSDPASLDPALVTDVDSQRISRQIFEGLVTLDATTGKPVPALASSWKTPDNGFSYEFDLRDDVKFQDGQPFNATAVCTNFNRWFNYPAQNNPTIVPAVFREMFKAFSNDPVNSVFKSCTAEGDAKVKIALNSAVTNFVEALSQPAFGIASPAALTSSTADVLDQQVGSAKVSKFGLNPVGTGPFKFSAWKDDTVTLSQNPNYWGDKGQIQTVNFVTYRQSQERLQALLTGKIDGYDSVTTDNYDPLVKHGLQVLQRDPFSVMYIGMNQQLPVMADLKARQAVAMAINKDAIVKSFFIDGSAPTNQFIPPKLSGFNKQVSGIGYDPDKARKTLSESSYKNEPLEFYYPLNVTRPYLPSPEKIYAEISAQLTAVGFNIKPVPIEWSDNYLAKVSSAGTHAFDLLGSQGSYSDPDNFVGPLFGASNGELGPADSQLASKIARARTLPDGSDRIDAYQAINSDIAQSVPALPIVFPISALALSAKVTSYPVSPVLNEVFNKIKLAS